MDPKAIGGLSLGATAGGSLLSAGGAIASGFANSQMYDYQAALARLNKQIADQNQEFSIQTGEQQAVKTGLQQAQQMGQIKTAQGASGLDVNSGSNKLVRESQGLVNQMDLNQIRSNAARQAYGYQIEGVQDTAQASLYSTAAQQSQTAGVIQGFGSILGGAASVSNQWLQDSRLGLWKGTALNFGGT